MLKRLIYPLVMAMLALSAAAHSAAAAGGAAPKEVAVKVAIINIDEILRQAAVAKNIRKQHKAFRDKVQSNIQKEEEELRTANQELARKKNLVSPEAFAEARRKFENRLMEVQRNIQERKHQLEQAQGKAMKKVQDALNDIVVEIAKEAHLTLIMRADQLVFWAKPLDITPEVLKRLDKKLPNIKLDLPDQSITKKAK